MLIAIESPRRGKRKDIILFNVALKDLWWLSGNKRLQQNYASEEHVLTPNNFNVLFFNLQIGAIILTPTRELAYQINEVVSHFLQYMPQFSSCLFIGGTTIQADVEKFVSKG